MMTRDGGGGGEMSDQNQEWKIVIPFIIASQSSPAPPFPQRHLATHSARRPINLQDDVGEKKMYKKTGCSLGMGQTKQQRLRSRNDRYIVVVIMIIIHCSVVLLSIIVQLSFQSHSTTCVSFSQIL